MPVRTASLLRHTPCVATLANPFHLWRKGSNFSSSTPNKNPRKNRDQLVIGVANGNRTRTERATISRANRYTIASIGKKFKIQISKPKTMQPSSCCPAKRAVENAILCLKGEKSNSNRRFF